MSTTCSCRQRRSGGGVDRFSRLAEELRTDRGGRDGAQSLHVLTALVVEAMNGAARDAEGLPGSDINPFAVDSKRATLPLASSPVTRNRTASGPMRMVSSEGL